MPKSGKKHESVFADKVVLFSGHGALCRDKLHKSFKVPANTTLTFWTRSEDVSGLGVNLLFDSTGKQIEQNLGSVIEKVADTTSPELDGKEHNLPVTYSAGEDVRNYVLLPPNGLDLGKPLPGTKMITVKGKAFAGRLLEDLLQKYSGSNCHWVACRESKGDLMSSHLTEAEIIEIN